ncbi:hypothetical protein Tco_1222344 [Tanacetum coccineum]
MTMMSITVIWRSPKAITPDLNRSRRPDNSPKNGDKHLEHFPMSRTLAQSQILSDYSTSSDDDSYENIEYVDATPPNLELVSLEEVEDVKPDQGGLTSIVISDNSNDPLLELPEFESFHFDLDPSFPRPSPEPPNVEINLIIKTNAPEINNVDELNEDKCFDPGGGEINVEDDDSFTFVIRIFLPFLTYPEDEECRGSIAPRSEQMRE